MPTQRRRNNLSCIVCMLPLAAACTPYGARPECPTKSGDSWLEVSSPHFRVLTDLPPDEAESTARELEENLEALTTIAFEHARTPSVRTTVVVFRSSSAFRAFVPELIGGQFMSGLPNDVEPSPFVVLRERLDAQSRIVLLHELTHDLFARNFGWAAPWLKEGWAQYYSTLRVEGGRAHLGARLPRLTFTDHADFFVANADNNWERVVAVPTRAVPRASELIAMDSLAFYASLQAAEPGPADRQRAAALYAGSWALVHMLLDGGEPYTPRFRAFLERARSGEALTHAWQQAFSDISMDRFDRDFRSYLFRRELAVWEMPVQTAAARATITRRPLGASDVHLLWARLTRWGGRQDVDAKRDLEEALAEAPDDAAPHYWMGLYALSHGDVRRADLELGEAIRRAPRDPRFRLGMVHLRARLRGARGPSDFAEAVDRLSEVAETATQLRVVAMFDRELKRADQAMEFAKKAYALAPFDPLILDMYATILFDQEQFEAAVAMQRKAVALLPEDVALPAFFERLRKYEARGAASHSP